MTGRRDYARFHPLAWILGLMLVALFGAVSAQATDDHSHDLILAEVMPFHANERHFIALSLDRRVVFVVITHGKSAADREAGHTWLKVFDISNPHSPHPISELQIGNFRSSRTIADGSRLFISELGDGSGSWVNVLDVQNPQVPRRIARIAIRGFSFDVADDGSCLAVAGYDAGPMTRTGYAIDANGHTEMTTCSTSGKTRSEYGREVVFDQLGARELVQGKGYIDVIRTRTQAGSSEYSLYSPDFSIGQAYFLNATGDLVVAETGYSPTPDSTGSLLVLRASKRAFDPALLVQADAAALKEYQRAQQSGSVSSLTFDRLDAELAASGASDASQLPAHEIRRARLVPALNDWAYWQSRDTRPLLAIPILQRIVKLAPERAIAWLNLADAARAGLTGALPGAEQTRLTRLALDAYAQHRRLTGVDISQADDFVALNAVNAPPETCARIAAYQNHSRLKEISVEGGMFDPDGSGHPLKLEVRYAGSLVLPYVAVENIGGNRVNDMSVFGRSTEGEAAGETLQLIPDHDTVFALGTSNGRLTELWDWSGRQVCHFSTKQTLTIAQSSDDAACRKLLTGKLPKAPLQSHPFTGKGIEVAADNYRSFWTGGEPGEAIKGVVDVDLSGSGKLERVGYIRGFQPHGACTMAGLVLLDGDKQQQGPRNAALLDAEWNLQDCRSADADIVQHSGRLFIEFDSERMNGNNETAKRTLMRMTGTSVETVCRIVERTTYAGERS